MKKLLCGALLLACVSPASAMSYFTGPNAATTVNDAAIVACDLSMVADVAVAAERAANAGGTVVKTGTTTKVQNVSVALCSSLGGVASATTQISPASPE